MSRTMAAYRVRDWLAAPEIAEVPVPEPGPGEVLVRVAGCGLCHSDLAMPMIPAELGRSMDWRVPFTLGHETAGHIAALGPGAGGLAEGDPVALVSPASCGSCWYCLRGHDDVCPGGSAGRGFGRDGGLAEYVLVDDVRALLPLAGGLDPRTAGPLTDAGATSYHAVRRVLPRVDAGGTAVVIGAGGLGAFAVQFLRRLTDARVVAVDAKPDRLAYARELGAHETLRGVGDGTAQEITALADGRGADAVLDFVGTDATIAAGVAAVRPAGAFGLVGAGGGRLDAPWFGHLPRDADVFTFQGSSIADVRDVLALAAAGRIRNDTETFPFERVAEAYAALHDGGLRGRAVVTVDA